MPHSLHSVSRAHELKCSNTVGNYDASRFFFSECDDRDFLKSLQNQSSSCVTKRREFAPDVIKKYRETIPLSFQKLCNLRMNSSHSTINEVILRLFELRAPYRLLTCLSSNITEGQAVNQKRCIWYNQLVVFTRIMFMYFNLQSALSPASHLQPTIAL